MCPVSRSDLVLIIVGRCEESHAAGVNASVGAGEFRPSPVGFHGSHAGANGAFVGFHASFAGARESGVGTHAAVVGTHG